MQNKNIPICKKSLKEIEEFDNKTLLKEFKTVLIFNRIHHVLVFLICILIIACIGIDSAEKKGHLMTTDTLYIIGGYMMITWIILACIVLILCFFVPPTESLRIEYIVEYVVKNDVLVYTAENKEGNQRTAVTSLYNVKYANINKAYCWAFKQESARGDPYFWKHYLIPEITKDTNIK